MSRELIRRQTAMGLALVEACNKAGITVTADSLPVKREATWSVTRRDKRK